MITKSLVAVVIAAAVAAFVFAKISRVMGKDVVKTPSATQASPPSESAASPLDFTLKDIDGKDVNLSQYKGKVVMLVNVASKCGYTPQYKGLESTYEKYKDRGFVTIGVP